MAWVLIDFRSKGESNGVVDEVEEGLDLNG